MRSYLLISRKVGEIGRHELKGFAWISALAPHPRPQRLQGLGGIRASGLQVNSENLSLLGWWRRKVLRCKGGLGRKARKGGEKGSQRVGHPVFQSDLQLRESRQWDPELCPVHSA